jgi:hypothetical protein
MQKLWTDWAKVVSMQNSLKPQWRYYCTYCCKAGHIKQNSFKLKKKETQYNNNQPSSNNNGNRENYDSQDLVLAATAKE